MKRFLFASVILVFVSCASNPLDRLVVNESSLEQFKTMVAKHQIEKAYSSRSVSIAKQQKTIVDIFYIKLDGRYKKFTFENETFIGARHVSEEVFKKATSQFSSLPKCKKKSIDVGAVHNIVENFRINKEKFVDVNKSLSCLENVIVRISISQTVPKIITLTVYKAKGLKELHSDNKILSQLQFRNGVLVKRVIYP